MGGKQRLLRSGQPDTQHHGTRKPRPGTALFYLTDTGSLGPKIIAAAYFIVFARYSNASEYAEVSSLEVGFRRKSQDTDTILVDFTSNRSRKPVVASWTAAPSSSSFRPKYHDWFSSIQPLAFLYYYPLALNALNQQVIKPWEQVGPHKYFPARTTFRHGPIQVNLYPLHIPLGKRWFTIWPLGGTPFLAHKILLLSALHISFNKCIAQYMFEQTLL